MRPYVLLCGARGWASGSRYGDPRRRGGSGDQGGSGKADAARRGRTSGPDRILGFSAAIGERTYKGWRNVCDPLPARPECRWPNNGRPESAALQAGAIGKGEGIGEEP